ncbi:hypothetical protein AB5I41_25865 [Sphingomonas sp. MMS24-JH45]
MLIDPAGEVYKIPPGALVDGAVVTLLDENDRPAVVFGGERRRTSYPSTVTSGGSVTDASGRRYDFTQGHYRFPLTSPGRCSAAHRAARRLYRTFETRSRRAGGAAR